jgi:hypothetical protein
MKYCHTSFFIKCLKGIGFSGYMVLKMANGISRKELHKIMPYHYAHINRILSFLKNKKLIYEINSNLFLTKDGRELLKILDYIYEKGGMIENNGIRVRIPVRK